MAVEHLRALVRALARADAKRDYAAGQQRKG
jgi:hypothetical protein